MSRCFPDIVLLAVSVSIAFVNPVASPPPPDVRASLSANGRFLVLTEREYDNPDPHGVRRIVRTTYQVMEADTFIHNSRDRLRTPATFWSESSPLSWQVTPEGNDGIRVFWPLISNDGSLLSSLG